MAETVECIAALLESCLVSVIMHCKWVWNIIENQNTLYCTVTVTLCMLTYITISYVVIGGLQFLSGICHGFLGKIPHYWQISETLILVDYKKWERKMTYLASNVPLPIYWLYNWALNITSRESVGPKTTIQCPGHKVLNPHHLVRSPVH